MFNDYNDEPTIFEKIETSKTLIKKTQSEIDEKQIIIDSLTDSLVRQVKSVVLPYIGNMLQTAWQEQDKEEKNTYKFIKKDVIERFFNGDKKAKLEKIVPCGYEHYEYNFYFTYHKIKFAISIPNVRAANSKNLYHMRYGAYSVLYEHKPSVWHTICTSYKEEDIAKAIQEFVSEKEIK